MKYSDLCRKSCMVLPTFMGGMGRGQFPQMGFLLGIALNVQICTNISYFQTLPHGGEEKNLLLEIA